MEFRELTEPNERRRAVEILEQLWTDVESDDIYAWTGQEEYHLFGGFVDGELVGVAGVVTAALLHHARHAWLYDLVVDEDLRSEGYGTELVEYVERWASDRDCEYVALASPRSKADVHRFYEERNYDRWGYVIEKEL